jgi:hypothetical protein
MKHVALLTTLAGFLLLSSCDDRAVPTVPTAVQGPSFEVTPPITASGDFSDSFEGSPAGTLSSDYSLLAGAATVINVAQRDGTTGHVLEIQGGGEPIGAVEVLPVGTQADVRMSFDQIGYGYLYLRATDLDNGYLVWIMPEGGGNVYIYRVEDGVKTRLAATRMGRTEYSLWRHFSIEARGNVIRVLGEDGSIVTATDETFASGAVLVGGSGRFDNIEVTADLPPVTPATPMTSPFSTGFDDLVMRDGALQHPALELIGPSGGISYSFAGLQSDGTMGRKLTVSGVGGYAAAEVVGSDHSDVLVEFENLGAAYGTARVYIRSSGPDNGYFVHIVSGGNGNADIFKVEDGVETRLAHGRPARTDYGIWRRFTLEARGNVIRLIDEDGAITTVTDNTFSNGSVLFAGEGTLFDNIAVNFDLPPQIPATPMVLPLNTGFDDLVLRDGGLQHPSLDVVGVATGMSHGIFPQRDGSVGRVMQIFGNTGAGVGFVEVSSEPISDARIEFDNYGAAYGTARVYVRSTGMDDGYYVYLTAGGNGFLSIYRVEDGVETRISEGRPARTEYGLWRRITIETRGNTIRVTDEDGVVVTATDNTFPAGSVFFAGTGSGTFYDNLVISSELAFPTPAEEITEALTTGFDDLELRDGALQHPNLELQGPIGGVTYGVRPQRDGSIGRIMHVTGGVGIASVKVASGSLADIRVQFENYPLAYGGGRVYVRSTGVDNGYFIEFAPPWVARIGRVTDGSETILAEALFPGGGPYHVWRELTVEVQGKVIRLLDETSEVVTAIDNTFSAGSVFFASVGGGEWYDNVSVDLAAFDQEGPVASNIVADPNPVMVNTPLSVTAVIDDMEAGGSNIEAAEFSLDGVNWTPMYALDGAYDGVSENVVADLLPFSVPTVVDLCIRGTDVALNTGPEACVLLAAFDPTGGFATGAGWIESPEGAFAPNPTLTGKAHFAFVSKYGKQKAIPDGNASFRFNVANLEFRSTSYDWLVVNQGGTNAQFKGSGTINDEVAPNGQDFRFMIWTGDDDPDTFRIKIWYEDPGEVVVYDNGVRQEIGAGNIKVHK